MSDLEEAIINQMKAGFGYYKRDMLYRLHRFGRRRVDTCMADMRQKGLIRYLEGYGYWYLPKQEQEAGE